jgi:hypothetical protein
MTDALEASSVAGQRVGWQDFKVQFGLTVSSSKRVAGTGLVVGLGLCTSHAASFQIRKLAVKSSW